MQFGYLSHAVKNRAREIVRESKTTFRENRRVQRQESQDPNHILVTKSLDPTQH